MSFEFARGKNLEQECTVLLACINNNCDGLCHLVFFTAGEAQSGTSSKQTETKVPHGYTAGMIFPHCTHTCIHRDLWWVAPLPTHNSCGVKWVPAVFCSINYTNI